MLIRETFERQGNWLFRYRSVLPLFGLPVVALALSQFLYPAHSHTADLAWELLCLAVSLSGLAVRAWTKGYVPRRTSGRNTRKGQVADTLNTLGPYSIVRNPLYAGNFLMTLGPVLFLQSAWFAALAVAAFFLYYERIIFAEEEFLRRKFGAVYETWAARTPLWIPRFRSWRGPERAFDLRHVIRQEYQGPFILILSFALLEFVGDAVVQGRATFDPLWVGLSIGATAAFLTIRFLVKLTRVLHAKPAAFDVEGTHEQPSATVSARGPKPGRRGRRRLLLLGIPLLLLVGLGILIWRNATPYHFLTVREGVLYRSGTLEAAELGQLIDEYGIKTVVNLRHDPDRWPQAEEERIVEARGAVFRDLPLQPDTPPTDEALAAWLRLLDDPERLPILVHCQHGVTRTCMFVAVYQMEKERQPNRDVLEKLEFFGHRKWADYRKPFRDFILDYQPRWKQAGASPRDP